jgi:hypothetical protein
MLIRPKTRQGLVIFQKSYETAASPKPWAGLGQATSGSASTASEIA